jgi:hypothetical protein
MAEKAAAGNSAYLIGRTAVNPIAEAGKPCLSAGRLGYGDD